MYRVGEKVEVELKFFDSKPTVKIKGTVMLRPRHLKPNEIALATGNPEFPVSVIDTERVVGYVPYKFKSQGRSFTVKSKDKSYNVLYLNNKYSCNCIGFGFRGRCKHIDAVAKKISESA
jgi:hypothetical protein